MEQNINLLTTINVQTTSSFNANLILQITGGWIALLILIYVFSFIAYTHKQKTLAGLELTQKNLKEQIDIFAQKLASLEHKNILKNLPFELTNSIGFYRHLKDLANFTPTNIWLNDIVFSPSNNSILFKGTATDPADIPVFIEALDKAKSFNGKKFHALQLQKNLDSENVTFALGTERAQLQEWIKK